MGEDYQKDLDPTMKKTPSGSIYHINTTSTTQAIKMCGSITIGTISVNAFQMKEKLVANVRYQSFYIQCLQYYNNCFKFSGKSQKEKRKDKVGWNYTSKW